MSSVLRAQCLQTYQTHIEATKQGALYHPSDDSSRERLLRSLSSNHSFLEQELLHVRSTVRLHVLLSARDKHGDSYANAIYSRAKASARHKPEGIALILSNMVIPMAMRADMASMQPTSVAMVFRDATRFAIPLSRLQASAPVPVAAPAPVPVAAPAAAPAPAPAPAPAAPAPTLDVKPIIFSEPAPVLAAPAPAPAPVPAPDVKPRIQPSPPPGPASLAPSMAEAPGNEYMPIPTLPPMSSDSLFGQSILDNIPMPPTVPASAQPADADSATDSDDDEQFADGDEFQHSMIPETATGASAATAAASPTDVDAPRETLSQNATISKLLASAKREETRKANKADVVEAGEKMFRSFFDKVKSEFAGASDEFISSKLVEALSDSRIQAVAAYDKAKAEVERLTVYKVQLAKQLDQQWEAGRISYRPGASPEMHDAIAQHSASKQALASAAISKRQVSHALKLAKESHRAKHGKAAKRAQKVPEATQANVVAMQPQSLYAPFSQGANNIPRLLELSRPVVNARAVAAAASAAPVAYPTQASATSSTDDSRPKKSRASDADHVQAAKRSKPALPDQFEHNALSMHLPVRHGNFSDMSRASYPAALPVMPVMSMAALQQPRGPPPAAAAAASSSSSSSFAPLTKEQLTEKIALLDNQIATVNTMISHVGPDQHYQRQLASFLTTKMAYLDMLSQYR